MGENIKNQNKIFYKNYGGWKVVAFSPFAMNVKHYIPRTKITTGGRCSSLTVNKYLLE